MHTTNSGGGHLTQRGPGLAPRTPTRGRPRGRTASTAGHGARARRPLRRPLRRRQPHPLPHPAWGPRQDSAPQAGPQTGAAVRSVRAQWWVSLTVRALTFPVLRSDRFVFTSAHGRRHPWPGVRSQRYHLAQVECTCGHITRTVNKCTVNACILRRVGVGCAAAGPEGPRNEPGVCQAQALGPRHRSLATEWW
jgi:hypothetical protein